jgi:hypothetical protein
VAIPPPAPAAETPIDDVLKLTIDMQQDSMVTLEIDGKSVLDERLYRGDHRTFEAKEAFRFRLVGNAGGLALTLNDIPLPPLGKRGQVVRDRVFDREALQELQSETRNST